MNKNKFLALARGRDSLTLKSLRLGELNDDFDVVRFSIEGFLKIRGGFRSSNELDQPRAVRPRQNLSGLLPMAFVGIDTTNQSNVFQHKLDPKSATVIRIWIPPVPTPVKQKTPPAPNFNIESPITCPTPVHSITISTSKSRAAADPE